VVDDGLGGGGGGRGLVSVLAKNNESERYLFTTPNIDNIQYLFLAPFLVRFSLHENFYVGSCRG
jgi:hypothetical protein